MRKFYQIKRITDSFITLSQESHLLMLNNPVLMGFIFSLLFFVFIGFLSTFKKKSSTKDYLLASQEVKPWLTALSAVATNNSGFMFVGMIAFTYTAGLSSIWIAFGWILGDLLISFIVFPKLREQAQKTGSLSYTELIGKWGPHNFPHVRRLAAFITFVFLCVYAAAQLKAGGKALHVLLGWDISSGALVGGAIVFLYCYAGGIRASIWTDAAQSFVMVFAMGLLLFVGVDNLGGFSATITEWKAVSPQFLSLFPQSLNSEHLLLGLFFYVFSWLFGGFVVAGQPHIMTRIMVIDSAKHIARVRYYYYSWYTVFFAFTIGVGMLSRVYLNDTLNFDAELALPNIALKLLPGVLVGFVLSGLFAATMSTADSQILSCTASVTRDFFPKKEFSLFATKLTTLVICCLSLIIALAVPANVFDLVLFAWSGLGSAFTPLLIIYVLKLPIREKQAMIMMLVGLSTAVMWRLSGLNAYLNEACPGLLFSFFFYFLSRSFLKLRA